MRMMTWALILGLTAGTAGLSVAQTAPEAQETAKPPAELGPEVAGEPPMTIPRLAQIIQAVDPEARFFGNGFEMTVDDIPILLITDPIADRMRAMVPIRSADGLSAEELMRVMQANFDSTLDARYAVAQGRLWAVYIHPLAALEREQFISGIIQTINVARTYGQSYSGGATVFGGGDSNGIYQELFEELSKRGQEL